MQGNLLFTKKTALWLGFAGMLGSLVMFAGDMLFYYNGDQTDLLANMGQVSPERIILSGVTALIGTWLYVAGAGQIYYAYQTANGKTRWAVFLSFLMIMIAYGIVHAAYLAIATSAQNAVILNAPLKETSRLAIDANQLLRKIVYIPFAFFTIAFTVNVWQKHTKYPRWVLLFSPILPFLLQDVVLGLLTGKAKTIIGGGYLNLLLLLFFAGSTLALRTEN
jgi:hypothetical protein